MDFTQLSKYQVLFVQLLFGSVLSSTTKSNEFLETIAVDSSIQSSLILTYPNDDQIFQIFNQIPKVDKRKDETDKVDYETFRKGLKFFIKSHISKKINNKQNVFQMFDCDLIICRIKEINKILF